MVGLGGVLRSGSGSLESEKATWGPSGAVMSLKEKWRNKGNESCSITVALRPFLANLYILHTELGMHQREFIV